MARRATIARKYADNDMLGPTIRVAMWLIYSDTWNAIVDELRMKDLLSEKEKRNLNFQHLPIDDSVEVRAVAWQYAEPLRVASPLEQL